MPARPVVLLPVPDPGSFVHLAHYLYFGSTYFIEEALNDGVVTWEGLARNVEYLEIGADVDLFLALYWRRVRTLYECSTSDPDGALGVDADEPFLSDGAFTEGADDAELVGSSVAEGGLGDEEVRMADGVYSDLPERGRSHVVRAVGPSSADRPGTDISGTTTEAPWRRSVSQ